MTGTKKINWKKWNIRFLFKISCCYGSLWHWLSTLAIHVLLTDYKYRCLMIGHHSFNILSTVSVILSWGKYLLKVLPLLVTHKVNYTGPMHTLPESVALNSWSTISMMFSVVILRNRHVTDCIPVRTFSVLSFPRPLFFLGLWGRVPQD